MAHFFRLGAALLLVAVAGCGGKSFAVNDPDPNGGTGNEAGTAQGGTGNVSGAAHGGTTSKGGTTSGGSGQGGVGGSLCDGFKDDAGYYVMVALVNNTMAPIYLGQPMATCSVDPLFQVKDASGTPLASPGGCRTPCQTGGAIGGCVASCAFPTSITLQPGERYNTTYNGLYEIQTELPKQCLAPGYDQARCDQAKQIRVGTFTFSAQAGSSLDCSPLGGSCSACMPTGNGCSTPGSLISGQMHNATTTVLLNQAYGVYDLPSPPPAPALPGGGSGSSSGALAQLAVELVFTE